MNKVKVIYMSGGADYTILPLKALYLSKKISLQSIYTKAALPSGRGKKVKDTPILEYVKKMQLPYMCPKNFKSNEEIKFIKKLNPDIILVYSYGLILPKSIIEVAKYGCINIHPSLLPKWRGPSPIQYSLLNNEKKTGFCIMEMNEEVDTGDIFLKKTIDIKKEDNTYTLLNRISLKVSLIIEKLLLDIIQNKIIKNKQEHSVATYSYKIEKKDTVINFKEEALKVYGKIKAYAPHPGARFFRNNEMIKVFDAEVVNNCKNYDKVGIILDNNLLISCHKGAIRLLKIQREGKKILPAKEVLNGWKLDLGTKINE